MSSFVEDVNIAANNAGSINTVAKNIDTLVGAIKGGGSAHSGGQYYGKGVFKPIGFLSNSTEANDIITIAKGTNAFAIGNITIGLGSEIIVEDGATFKIL